MEVCESVCACVLYKVQEGKFEVIALEKQFTWQWKVAKECLGRKHFQKKREEGSREDACLLNRRRGPNEPE